MVALGGGLFLMSEVPLQPAVWEQILFVGTPDLYHRSPDSGDLQYRSRALKKVVCDRAPIQTAWHYGAWELQVYSVA